MEWQRNCLSNGLSRRKAVHKERVILVRQRSERYMKALGTFIAIVLFLAGAGLVGCNNVGTTWRPDLDPTISAPGKL
jgi:hypothetical protein